MNPKIGICSIIALCFLTTYIFGGVGDGGVNDSTVTRRFTHSLTQPAYVGSFNASSMAGGDMLFSECYFFDMKVDAADTAYTRGIQNLSDTTFRGGKFLDLENYIGDWMRVLVYRGIAGSMNVSVEQAAFYDSTTFTGITGANYGYWQSHANLFGTSLTGVAGGGVAMDSFRVVFPIVRLRFIENAGAPANTDTFYFAGYIHRPVEQFSAPQGEYKQIGSKLR